jgi:hypothetical protein
MLLDEQTIVLAQNLTFDNNFEDNAGFGPCFHYWFLDNFLREL